MSGERFVMAGVGVEGKGAGMWMAPAVDTVRDLQ